MQSDRISSTSLQTSNSSEEILGPHFRWQIVLALLGFLLLATLLNYSPTYTVKTVSVPDQGGVFREGVIGQFEYLNPLFCDRSAFDQTLCRLVYRGLTKFDDQGNIVADLAESWEITDEGRTYTFQLRTDQLWNNGTPVTAEDVIFTIGIIQDPDVQRLPALSQLWRNVEIFKSHEYEVKFTLKDAFPPFLEYTTIGLLPQHIWHEKTPTQMTFGSLNRIAVGTGPLKMAEIGTEYDYIRMQPNPYYSGRQPYLSALEFHLYPSPGSLLAAFEANQIDGISQILPEDIEHAANNPDLELFSALDNQNVVAVFNLAKSDLPFAQDKSVRQALYYALDRESLVNEVLAGQAEIASNLFLPTSWVYNPSTRQYPYDRSISDNILREAGWKDTDGDTVLDKAGQPLQFSVAYAENLNDIAQSIIKSWRSMGIRVNALPYNPLDFTDNILPLRAFDIVLVSFNMSGDPDPYPFWHSTQAGAGDTLRQNYSGWQNLEADAMMEAARRTEDDDERRLFYYKFQEIFNEELPALPLIHPVYTYGVHKRVKGVQIGQLYDMADRFNSIDDWYIVTSRLPETQAGSRALPLPPNANN